ncbi:MAG: flagellin [Vampirovibrionales bacterium]|nr:flagellin [Vampirovibrionales bacterium]
MIGSVGALSALGSLSKITSQLESSSKRLSSGSKFSSVGFDAAGLTIAAGLSSQVRGNNAASANLQNGSNALNVASGALQGQLDSLQQLKGLAVQAANGTNSPDSSAAIQAQASQITAGIDQVADSTQFNGKNLLDGSNAAAGSFVIQGGPSAGNSTDISSSFTDASSAGLGLAGLDLSTQAGASAGISAIDNAISQVSAQMASIGAADNGLQAQAANLETSTANVSASLSQIADTDFAAEITQQKSLQYAAQASVMMLKAQSKTSGSLLELLRSGP